LFKKPLPDPRIADLEPLFPLLQKRSGPIVEHLFTFLEEIAGASSDPLPFIKAMLSARDKNLALRALKCAVRLAEKGNIKTTYSFIQFLAGRMDMEKTPLTETEAMLDIQSLIKRYAPGERFRYKDPFLALYLEEDNIDLRHPYGFTLFAACPGYFIFYT